MRPLMHTLEPRLLLSSTPTFVVAFDDPMGVYSDWYNKVRSTLLAAANDWAQYIDSAARIELKVDFDPFLTRPTLATAGFDQRVFFRKDSVGGYDVSQGNVGSELRTGVDANGSDADANISIRPGALGEFFFDSSAGRTANVPGDKIDARSVLLHELGHTLGVFGDGDGPHDSPAGSRLTFDQYVHLDGTDLYFTGPNTLAAHTGTRVALSEDDSSHVGNDFGPGSDLADDLMSPAIPDGQKRFVSAVDLGLIADAGVPMKTTAAPYVSTTAASAVRGVDSSVNFTISLSQPSLSVVTVPLYTINGSAVAGRDYSGVNTTLTFAPGETSKTLSVPLLAGSAFDGDKSFTLNFDLPANAVLLTGQSKGSIKPGELAADARHRAVFTDSTGSLVTISMKGPGTATIHRNDDGDLMSISILGSTGATGLTIKSGGPVTLQGLSAPGGLGTLSAPTTSFDGAFSLIGTTKVTLLDVAAGSTLTFAASSRPLTFSARNVTDASITAGAVRSFAAFSFTNTDSTLDVLSASSLTSLTIRNELSGNVSVAGAVKTINVGSWKNSTIHAFASVNAATFGAAQDCNLFIATDGWADSPDDFTATAALKSVTIKPGGVFSNTRISAPTIRAARLALIQTDNDGTAFGLSTRSLTTLTASTPASPKLRRTRLTPPQLIAESDFQVRLV